MRDEQIGMASAVDQALRTRGRLVVEAGTGTGKTFAYLVPALLSGKRIVISTGTRTLQDQLFARELPTVAAAVGRPVRIALLKGRANSPCACIGSSWPTASDDARARARSRGRVAECASGRDRRVAAMSGLAAFGESAPVWPWVTSTRDNCLGPECAFFDRCHVVQARRDAPSRPMSSSSNHHLLMADLGVEGQKASATCCRVPMRSMIEEVRTNCQVSLRCSSASSFDAADEGLTRDLSAEMLSGARERRSRRPVQTIERPLHELQDGSADRRSERVEPSSAGRRVHSSVSIICSARCTTLAEALASTEHAGWSRFRAWRRDRRSHRDAARARSGAGGRRALGAAIEHESVAALRPDRA